MERCFIEYIIKRKFYLKQKYYNYHCKNWKVQIMKRREFLINSAITVAGLSLLMGTGEAKEVAGKKGIKKNEKKHNTQL